MNLHTTRSNRDTIGEFFLLATDTAQHSNPIVFLRDTDMKHQSPLRCAEASRTLMSNLARPTIRKKLVDLWVRVVSRLSTRPTSPEHTISLHPVAFLSSGFLKKKSHVFNENARKCGFTVIVRTVKFHPKRRRCYRCTPKLPSSVENNLSVWWCPDYNCESWRNWNFPPTLPQQHTLSLYSAVTHETGKNGQTSGVSHVRSY